MTRQCDVLTTQNKKFQNTINTTVKKMEETERDYSSIKEVSRTKETLHKELVSKMRTELDTVEERWLKVINQNTMVAEDFRARSLLNWEKLVKIREYVAALEKDYRKIKSSHNKLSDQNE